MSVRLREWLPTAYRIGGTLKRWAAGEAKSQKAHDTAATASPRSFKGVMPQVPDHKEFKKEIEREGGDRLEAALRNFRTCLTISVEDQTHAVQIPAVQIHVVPMLVVKDFAPVPGDIYSIDRSGPLEDERFCWVVRPAGPDDGRYNQGPIAFIDNLAHWETHGKDLSCYPTGEQRSLPPLGGKGSVDIVFKNGNKFHLNFEPVQLS